MEKYPQYELYKFTRKLHLNKEKMLPKNCNNRCVYSTIINRCYYSSYLYVLEWLFEKYKFKPLSKNSFDNTDEFVTEHKQVRDELKDVNYNNISTNLFDLFILRKKADYDPFSAISDNELDRAMCLMERIFQTLKI